MVSLVGYYGLLLGARVEGDSQRASNGSYKNSSNTLRGIFHFEPKNVLFW